MESYHRQSFEQDVIALEEITLQLGWLMRRALDQELAAYRLTVPQYMALRCIQESQDGCSMSELAEQSYQVSATMTGIVDRLVEAGFVQRERAARDRRALRVALTEQGQELLARISESKRAWLRQILMDLPPEERRGMIAAARTYLERLEATVAV